MFQSLSVVYLYKRLGSKKCPRLTEAPEHFKGFCAVNYIKDETFTPNIILNCRLCNFPQNSRNILKSFISFQKTSSHATKMFPTNFIIFFTKKKFFSFPLNIYTFLEVVFYKSSFSETHRISLLSEMC